MVDSQTDLIWFGDLATENGVTFSIIGNQQQPDQSKQNHEQKVHGEVQIDGPVNKTSIKNKEVYMVKSQIAKRTSSSLSVRKGVLLQCFHFDIFPV